MFEKLYTKPSTLYRHNKAPYKEERERYLRHCEQEGYALLTLQNIARELLWVAQKLRTSLESGVTLKQVEAAARGWTERERYWGQALNPQCIRSHFVKVARAWLRFLGCWREPETSFPFGHLLEDFRTWMKDERGFTFQTIRGRCSYVERFLRWYGTRSCQISDVCLKDIDAFLSDYGSKGNCRISVKDMATALKAFFKYSGAQGWCPSSIAPEIHGPRIFAQEQLPLGPSWNDVRRLIASMETDQAADIRDKAIVMLFAVYGFRSTEVATLRLDDIDWEQGLISVARVKRRGRQTYPLIPIAGNAIIRYLQEVRPQSSYREIFLTLVPPYRPFSLGALYPVVGNRMVKLGIHTHHHGPHSLRHACATHLVSEGFSLKEVGDHLGHRSSLSTRIYAKVDLPSLREVAKFDIGGLA
jgi:site-specific recombinase XerD